MEQRFDHIGDHELDAATKEELRAVTNGFLATIGKGRTVRLG